MKLLSVREVADQLGRSPDYVRRLCQRRLIGHVKDGPRGRLQFTQAQVDAWVRARTVEPIRQEITTLDQIWRRRGAG